MTSAGGRACFAVAKMASRSIAMRRALARRRRSPIWFSAFGPAYLVWSSGCNKLLVGLVLGLFKCSYFSAIAGASLFFCDAQ